MVDDEIPALADLHRHVVPKYAHRWEDLGLKLGLDANHIALISKNNAYNPDRTRDCCKDMLAKWLNLDTSATWRKLKDAVGGIRVDEPALRATASKSSVTTFFLFLDDLLYVLLLFWLYNDQH